jgi:hypothetical protein
MTPRLSERLTVRIMVVRFVIVLIVSLIALTVVLAAADRNWSNAPVVESNGVQTNPAGTVMADTGVLPSNKYELHVIAGGTATGVFTIERRNAANGANVGDTVAVRTVANQSQQFTLYYFLNTNERLRVIATGTGDFEATVVADRLQ